MKPKDLNYIKNLIDQEIINNNKKDLILIKNYLNEKINQLNYHQNILNNNLKYFLENEKSLTNLKGRLYTEDIINAVATFRHKPNSLVIVNDLLGIDLNWFLNQYHIGEQTITYLENFLQSYGYSLYIVDTQIIKNQDNNYYKYILDLSLESFLRNHLPAYELNTITYQLEVLKKEISFLIKKPSKEITVRDAIKVLNSLPNNYTLYYLKKALERYIDVLPEIKPYLLTK